MIPERSDIIDLVPVPEFTDEKLVELQSTDDILACCYNNYKLSIDYSGEYAKLFLIDNVDDTGNINIDAVCNDIWDFMQYEWPYDKRKAETEHYQTGRTISAIIYNVFPEKFDCKHYAIFAYTTLQALSIKCEFRLTSYDPTLIKSPSHIYVVAFDKDGKEFVIDGTMPAYNQEDPNYTQRYIVSIKQGT